MATKLWVALLTGTGLAACPVAALAQAAPNPTTDIPAADPAPTADQDAPPADQGKDIIITGSRIVANGNDRPTPVTVVSSQDLAVSRADDADRRPQYAARLFRLSRTAVQPDRFGRGWRRQPGIEPAKPA